MESTAVRLLIGDMLCLNTGAINASIQSHIRNATICQKVVCVKHKQFIKQSKQNEKQREK
jgi:hypothetical protein